MLPGQPGVLDVARMAEGRIAQRERRRMAVAGGQQHEVGPERGAIAKDHGDALNVGNDIRRFSVDRFEGNARRRSAAARLQQFRQVVAKAAARQVGLAILASLRAELGTLDRIKRLIKVLGMVNSTAEFQQHPAVINGCSELFADVFGKDNGVGARSAVGMIGR